MNAFRLTTVALLTATCGVLAQDPAPAPENPPAQQNPDAPKAKKKLTYTVRKEVAEGTRRDGDGASRNDLKIPKWLTTLVPSSGRGLTISPQPSLFSWQSEAAKAVFLVTVTEPGKTQPLFVFAANSSAQGYHRVDLSQYGISLAPNLDYEWSVAVVPDQKKRSGDLIAVGRIRRIEPDAALAEKIKTAAPADLAAIYAEAGLWYDALGAIADQVAANPKDKELVALRNGLLESQNLGVVTGKEKVPERKTGEARGGPLKLNPAKGVTGPGRRDGDGPSR